MKKNRCESVLLVNTASLTYYKVVFVVYYF